MSPLHQARREVVRPSTADATAGRLPDELNFLKGLIEGMRCGLLSIDRKGRVMLLNEDARRILELTEAPVPGTPLWQALPRHPQLVRALTSSFGMSSLPNRAEMELEHLTKSIGFTVSLVHGPDGKPSGAAMFFKDLTPIEHKAEQERLKDRLAALGQMAASMAHEIRNPLASIEVTCKLLERRLQGDGSCRDLLEKITSEVRRLDSSVDSCLQYVRPVSPSLTPADLGAMLEEAVVVAEGRRGKPGIEIRRSFDVDIPPFKMDAGLLRQVFVNLLLNALEAVGDSGSITISAGREPAPEAASIPYHPSGPARDPWGDVRQFAVVRIRDSGPGIGEEERDRIFQPFFTTKKHGSGVGLAVAKKIVGSHRGLIDVTSAPGEGAEIVVRLPIVERAAEGMRS
jgi:signal transduction histidine kinase